MIGPSKILTVSYGTFSCTLEGFDDPFNTMKAIAEYFRDLAAGDRYFGAEPPIPDAAMLHKIAEREIHRRVEAKIQENGVILRTGEAMSPAAQIAPAPPVAAPAPVAPSVAAPTVAPEAPAGYETAAQRLSRLRAAQIVEPARAAPVAAPAPAAVETYAEDQDVEAAAAPIFTAPPVAEPAVAALLTDLPEETMPDDSIAEEDLSNLRALDGDAPAQADVTGPVADVIESSDQQTPDLAEVAASADILIAAVDQDLAEPASPYADPQFPEDLTDTTDQPDAAEAASWLDSESLSGEVIEDADQEIGFDGSDADDTADHPAMADAGFGDDAFADSADDLADTILASLARQTRMADAAEEPLEDLAEDGFEPAGFDHGPGLNGSFSDRIAEAADAEELDDSEAPAAEAPAAEIPQAEEAAAAAETAAEPATDPDLVEKVQRARARVIKIRRGDAPSIVIGRGPAPAVAPPVEAVAVATAAHNPSEPELDAQAQAALMAALADAATAPAEAAPATQLDSPQPSAVAGVDAVDRLMAETTAHLEVPETKRRQSAIAHLKAAVAATIADRLTNPREAAKKAEARLNPYRKDLEKVVGATRPGEAVGAERPAPLVLVSSQRIDRPKPAAEAPGPRTVQPVRPRRVTSGGQSLRPVSLVGDDEDDAIAEEVGENIFAASGAQSFPEFAEKLGVSNMPDLLEAAAAYCALVLGREQFSRPLLLETVARLPGSEDTSLEDSLRGFGTLLRDGRITKVKRGQFQLSDDSHLLTEARRFAG
jgi:hypothetical protein